MGFLSICQGDPLVETLRSLFGANIVRVPEERIEPLTVMASCERKLTFRGRLSHLIDGNAPNLNDIPVATSGMANISGKRTHKVTLDIGLQVLEGFLGGFGIPSTAISAKFEGASEVSFSFQDVTRFYVETNLVGQMLNGHSIDRDHVAASIFFADDPCDLLVIDSIITSSDFSISVDRSSNDNFRLDVPAIKKVVGELQTGVSVSTTTGYDLIFKGDKQLTFAFSCIRLVLDKEGLIVGAPPGINENVFSVRSLPEAKPTVLYSPDRVLLTSEPCLIEWD